MSIRLLAVSAILILILAGTGAAFLGAWAVDPLVFWCGVSVLALGIVIAGPEAEDGERYNPPSNEE